MQNQRNRPARPTETPFSSVSGLPSAIVLTTLTRPSTPAYNLPCSDPI